MTTQQLAATIDVPFDYAMIGRARSSVAEVLVDWQLPQLVEPAQLVVTELVTNALEHARSPCRVTVLRSGRGIRIEARDDGPGAPQPQPTDHQRERGRGLRIVTALSADWGTCSDRSSKVVWAELAEQQDLEATS